MTIVEATRSVTGGIDTHGEVHVAAVLDEVGGPSTCSLSGEPSFALREADGTPPAVGNDAKPLHTIRPVTLQPQGSAYVTAEWSNWCGTALGPLDIMVTLPNGTSGVTGDFDGPPNHDFAPQCIGTDGPSEIRVVDAYMPNA